MNIIHDAIRIYDEESDKALGILFISGSGIPIITDYSQIDREIIGIKDGNAIIFGEHKMKIEIHSIVELQKTLRELASVVREGIISIYKSAFPPVYEELISQLTFDILYDKYLDDLSKNDKRISLYGYCNNHRMNKKTEKMETVYAFMRNEILDVVEKYSSSDLIPSKQKLCVDPDWYLEYLDSIADEYKRNKKVDFSKAMPKYLWDYIYYNGNSKLITSKQFTGKFLSGSSKTAGNFTHKEFVRDFEAYDKFVQRFMIRKRDTKKDYFLKTMGYYLLEIHKRLDFIYKLAVRMERDSNYRVDLKQTREVLIESSSDLLFSFTNRFIPNVLYLSYNSDYQCINEISIFPKYYKPLLLVEEYLQRRIIEEESLCMELFRRESGDLNAMEKLIRNTSGQNKLAEHLDDSNHLHLLRAITYELFKYNFSFQSEDYKDISNFIFRRYNILCYHDSSKVWTDNDTGNPLIRRIRNAQMINEALFLKTDSLKIS